MIVSKTIIINSPRLPPEVDYIEEQIKLQGLKPVRWAIVDIKDNELILSVSAYEI